MEERWKRSEETRAKLIDAAGQVFSRRGFRATTVREICSLAGAPLGAVNYHFRGKQGLYEAVFEYSMESAIEKYPPQLGIADGATPEDKLRAFVRSFLLRVLDQGVPAWHMKLIAQEISDPAGASDDLLESVIQPVYRYLVCILTEILKKDDAGDDRESDLVFLSAMSIVGQCLYHFTGRRVIEALCPKNFNAEIEQIADHITQFSLYGIRRISKKKRK